MVYDNVVMYFMDVSNNPHHLALVVYHFPPGKIPKAQKHGNANVNDPFYPSWASTKELIKSECRTSGPKQMCLTRLVVCCCRHVLDNYLGMSVKLNMLNHHSKNLIQQMNCTL